MASLSLALFILRVVSPTLVFLSAISLSFERPVHEPSPSPIISVVVATRVPRRVLILSLLSLSALTYLLDGITFVIYAVIDKIWPHNTGIDINVVVGLAAFSGLAALGAWKNVCGVDVWSLKRVKASIAISLALDVAQVTLIGYSIRSLNQSPPIGIPENPRTIPYALLLHFAFPCLRILVLVPLLAAILSPRVVYTSVQCDETIEAPEPEASSLLLPHAQASTGLSVSGSANETTKYGTFRTLRPPAVPASQSTTRTTSPQPPNQDQKNQDPEVPPDPSWREIARRLHRISPYLWPSNHPHLQFLAALCMCILLVGRFVNAAVPFAFGEIVRIFEEKSNRSPWPYLFAYVGLRFLQSGGGLSVLKDILWAPVMQYSDREMAQLSFDHLLKLSFSFHMHRKTGEILRILDRGSAINHVLEFILFSGLPTMIDITIALVIFCVKFGWLLSLVIFIVMLLYVSISIVLTSWRTAIRRQMNDRDVVPRGIHTDCLLNYETIKYFGGEEHEGNRYREAYREYQILEYKMTVSWSTLSLAQNFVISTGLLIGSMIVARRVTNGQAKASDFVIFITYLSQLYGPLNSLGWIYRALNSSLVDTEKLLNLLDEPTEVDDKPDAPDLVVGHGEIEFQNVSFSYDGRNRALDAISFKVKKGSSVALVGESGAGKSTVLRLLYRFYDLADGDGKILIDGQDIRKVTHASLRKAIGVVPQDPVLFNSSIKYNVGYGKIGASPEEIEGAAKAAQMHERILSFPNGYETTVGERGIRLSGGEKQRVAIARTLLKDPPILLLDEATSALDTSTEKDIQKALQNLVKGRSSLSIAHRLSTIASADVILVLKDGQIVEQGNHKELLALGGLFASMWADQIASSDDLVIPLGEDDPRKENSGYVVNETDPAPLVEVGGAPEGSTPNVMDGGLVDTPEMILANLPPEDVPAGAEAETADSPSHQTLAVQTGNLDLSSTTPAASLRSPGLTPAQSPGVTFGSEVNTSPRSGTPDAESEPKRKRISSQNFQRLARKMSLNTRRAGSTSSIPIISGLLRDNSPRESTDGSVREREDGRTDSPTRSLPGDSGKKRKERKRKSIL